MDFETQLKEIHGVETRLSQALILTSNVLSQSELQSESQDDDTAKDQFDEACTNLAQLITEIQAGLKALLDKLASTGVLDAAGKQLPFQISTAGVEKDLEVVTNAIRLCNSVLNSI